MIAPPSWKETARLVWPDLLVVIVGLGACAWVVCR